MLPWPQKFIAMGHGPEWAICLVGHFEPMSPKCVNKTHFFETLFCCPVCCLATLLGSRRPLAKEFGGIGITWVERGCKHCFLPMKAAIYFFHPPRREEVGRRLAEPLLHALWRQCPCSPPRWPRLHAPCVPSGTPSS